MRHRHLNVIFGDGALFIAYNFSIAGPFFEEYTYPRL